LPTFGYFCNLHLSPVVLIASGFDAPL